MSRRRQKLRYEQLFGSSPDLFEAADIDLTAPLTPLSDNSFDTPERLRFISFGSGSSGNCAYLGAPSCGILIDAGVDNNYVVAQLAMNAINPATIAGILLTHDHSDHVRYAYALLRRFRHMKLFATPKAMTGLLRRHNMSRRIKDYHHPFYKEFPFNIGPLTVTAFETSHDGTDNSGFYIEGFGTSFVITTDTGTITARADNYIRQASHLMIESNYDAHMLRTGPYPERLKARIASTIGHLDNADTARYLASVCTSTKLRTVLLCHLSHENNTPAIALSTIRDALDNAGIRYTGIDAPASDPRLKLSVLPRLESSLLTVFEADT